MQEKFVEFVRFLPGIAVGFAVYLLVGYGWGSEVVVYGQCYDFGGEILDCQPDEATEPCDSFYAPQMGGRLDCPPGEASPGRGVTVEPGLPVPNLGCHSECYPLEAPYVYQEVPKIAVFVGVFAAMIIWLAVPKWPGDRHSGDGHQPGV